MTNPQPPASLRPPPTGALRLFLRMPIFLYRVGLGGLLGGRFLLLNHIGRKSGLPRQAVVEVVRHDPATGSYIIASGFGEKSDWLRNLRATPDVMIQVGRRKLAVRAERLTVEAGSTEMADYARRYPVAARTLARSMGMQVDGSVEGYRACGALIPFVRLDPIRPK